MTTTERESRLPDALAALYGHLWMSADDARVSAAESFIGELATHLRRYEERLFPALRECSAAAEDVLKLSREEHESLRVFASELARRVAANDREGAAAVAESMMAALFEHLASERQAVDSLLNRLQPDLKDRVLRQMGDVDE